VKKPYSIKELRFGITPGIDSNGALCLIGVCAGEALEVADVLFEIVRTELELRAAERAAYEASKALDTARVTGMGWSGAYEIFQLASEARRVAGTYHDAALAKVTLHPAYIGEMI
jgi:hypothetical protein